MVKVTYGTYGRQREVKHLGVHQRHILKKLSTHDGWWSPERQIKLGVGYRVTRILNSLVRRGFLTEAGGVYTLTVAGRQEIQK